MDTEDAVVLICESIANPDQVFFEWRKNNNETVTEGIENHGLESTLTLDLDSENLGDYFCYVSNSVGEGIPCVGDVQSNFMKIARFLRIQRSNFKLKFKLCFMSCSPTKR